MFDRRQLRPGRTRPLTVWLVSAVAVVSTGLAMGIVAKVVLIPPTPATPLALATTPPPATEPPPPATTPATKPSPPTPPATEKKPPATLISTPPTIKPELPKPPVAAVTDPDAELRALEARWEKSRLAPPVKRPFNGDWKLDLTATDGEFIARPAGVIEVGTNSVRYAAAILEANPADKRYDVRLIEGGSVPHYLFSRPGFDLTARENDLKNLADELRRVGVDILRKRCGVPLSRTLVVFTGRFGQPDIDELKRQPQTKKEAEQVAEAREKLTAKVVDEFGAVSFDARTQVVRGLKKAEHDDYLFFGFGVDPEHFPAASFIDVSCDGIRVGYPHTEVVPAAPRSTGGQAWSFPAAAPGGLVWDGRMSVKAPRTSMAGPVEVVAAVDGKGDGVRLEGIRERVKRERVELEEQAKVWWTPLMSEARTRLYISGELAAYLIQGVARGPWLVQVEREAILNLAAKLPAPGSNDVNERLNHEQRYAAALLLAQVTDVLTHERKRTLWVAGEPRSPLPFGYARAALLQELDTLNRTPKGPGGK